MKPPRRTLRTARFISTLPLLGAAALAFAQNPLPSGFGGVSVGMKWDEVASQFELQSLDGAGSSLDEFAAQCGYRTALLPVDQGKLLLTANDHIVTEVAYITTIKAGSDLVAAADLVMQSYGQPAQASMRDLSGQVTIDPGKVNFVNLSYGSKRKVEFSLSGRDLWQYQVSVTYEHYRWHQNKTLRCARDLEREKSQS